jgi:uncharacterized protein (DUF983 family)
MVIYPYKEAALLEAIEMTEFTSERSAGAGLKRGLLRRCPNCGKGHLFTGYLAVEPHCAACGHENALYRADDGPAYFTILIVGHLVLVPLLCLSFILTWPVAVVLPLSLAVVLVATLALLPLVKGAFIGVQWATHGATAH